MAVEVNLDRKMREISWEKGDYNGEVRVVATGEAGDVHNTSDMPNDGFAVLTYPADFTGESHVQVLGVGDDTVVDEGTITID